MTASLVFLLLSFSLSSSEQSIQCRSSSWLSSPQTLPANRINDNFCDCPVDGLDEPLTSACSGSSSWAGLLTLTSHSQLVCPGSSVPLPTSRIHDGICDCCDGLDELPSTCPNRCEAVRNAQRAEREKLEREYLIGSQLRGEARRQFQQWMEQRQRERSRQEQERQRVEREWHEGLQRWTEDKLEFGREWRRRGEKLGGQMWDLVMGDTESRLTREDLMSFLISLCWLEGEMRGQQDTNREKDKREESNCSSFDWASLDVGILWTTNDDTVATLPTFTRYLEKSENDPLLVSLAERILLRFGIKDNSEHRDSVTIQPQTRKENKHIDEQDIDIDHDYNSDLDTDDYPGEENDFISSEDIDFDSPSSEHENVPPVVSNYHEDPLNHTQVMGSARLQNLSISSSRALFVNQARALLNISLTNLPYDESITEDIDNDNGESQDKDTHSIDPMAMQMVQATLQKRLSNIYSGKSSAKYADIHITSLQLSNSFAPMNDDDDDEKNGITLSSSLLKTLQHLVVLTLYHSKVSAKDLAELIYTTSSIFQLTSFACQDDDNNNDSSNEQSCPSIHSSSCSLTSSWRSMCPPLTLPSEKFSSTTSFPLPFIVEAAQQRCRERQQHPTLLEEQTVCQRGKERSLELQDFPISIPEGYFGYFSPQPRVEGTEEDLLILLFRPLDEVYSSTSTIVEHIRDLHSKWMEQSKRLEDRKHYLESEIRKINADIGDDGKSSTQSGKFGLDGELYLLRDDLCHKIVSGKYEYEVCLFGRATQRDIGQSDTGGTDLGHWDNSMIQEKQVDGMKRLLWSHGTKCWNGPHRSAEVLITCGSATKLLTAEEPETCKYLLTMESPIGCDDQFKKKNLL